MMIRAMISDEHRLRDLLLAQIGRLGGTGDGGHEEREERGETEGAKHPIHIAETIAQEPPRRARH